MRRMGIGTRIFVVVALTALFASVAVTGTRRRSFSRNSFAFKHSLAVIGPNGRAFEGWLEHDFPFLIDVNKFQEVKPLLAIVHNNTKRAVKAYVVEWKITNADGSITTSYLPVISEPYFNEGTLSGTRTVLGPAGTGLGTQLVSPFFHWSKREFPGLLKINAVMISFQAANMKPLVTNVQSASNIRVRLDGAIFGDGVFVGPDTSKLYEKFQAEQQAEVDEGAWILTELNSGATSQQIREKLSEQIYSGRNATGADPTNLVTAARGEEASRFLNMLVAEKKASLRAIAGRLANARGLTLRRRPYSKQMRIQRDR